MKFEQIVDVTQKALAQAMGEEYMTKTPNLAALESYKLADIGKDVLDVTNSTEKFTKALISVLAKIEYVQSNIADEFGDLFVDSTEWGGFVERVYFNPATFEEDKMWNLVNGTDYSSYEHKFYQPSTQAKIFEEMKAGVIPISIQQETLKEAFKGWDELNAYVSGIQSMVRNTVKMVKKNHAKMLVACGIAISDKATTTSRHLLTEAIAQGIVPTGTTAKKALNNPDFLAYAAKEISKVRDEMKVESAVYNNGSIVMGADVVKLYVLKDFERSLRFNLRADTFNPEDRSIGDYKAVTSWQGVIEQGKKFDFDTLSTIKIAADADNKLGIGTAAVTINNVIGFAFDERALGFTLAKEKITSNYTASQDFYTQWMHLRYNLICDSNCPMVAFIVD